MKIAIYHPGLPNLGGGETVALTLARDLAKDHEVDVFCPYKVDKAYLAEYYGLNLDKVNIVRFGAQLNWAPKTIKPYLHIKSIQTKLERYDRVIDTFTNGWFDSLLTTKTYCYIHFPLFFRKKTGVKSLLNRFMADKDKAFQYTELICNSAFTKGELTKYTDKVPKIVYPPVSTLRLDVEKTDTIITVGRYSPEKKHEILIQAFKEFNKSNPTYNMMVIGSGDNKDYFNYLQELAKDTNIIFQHNLPHSLVIQRLAEAKQYWHARGYGESDPTEYENFGITTVEAMQMGCIPVVINLGAQPEIVKSAGYTWNTADELVHKAQLATKRDATFIKSIKERASIFSAKRFTDEMREILFS